MRYMVRTTSLEPPMGLCVVKTSRNNMVRATSLKPQMDLFVVATSRNSLDLEKVTFLNLSTSHVKMLCAVRER